MATGPEKVGVYAAPPGCEYNESECDDTLTDFVMIGVSVEEFDGNGIQTRWVDGFHFQKCKSVNNLVNGLYATLSSNGLINECVSTGSLDSGVWVAGSTDTNVTSTEIYSSVTGLEVTVSDNLYLAHNDIHDNVVSTIFYVQVSI